MEILNKYKYVLMDRFGIIETVPLGESNFSIAYDQETDGKYFYTKEFQGKITFTGEAYRRLKLIEGSIYICTQQRLQVFRICDTTETLIFDGYFKLTEGDWNLDLCKVVLKFEKSTPDRCLSQNKNVKVNLLQEIYNKITVKTGYPGGTLQVQNCFHSSPQPQDSDYWCGTGDPYAQNWTLVNYDVHSPDGNHHFVSNKWARELIELLPGQTPLPGWVLVPNPPTPTPNDVYAKPVALFDCVVENQPEDPDFGSYGYSRTCKILGYEGTSTTIDNGVLLKDVLQLFVTQKFCPGIQVVSDFFQINPQNPSNVNYVTGAFTQTNNLVLFQKSDVKRANAYGNATKAEWTFEKLIEMLGTVFNVFYSVENGVFRLEHISWFSRNAGFNLTLPKYAKFIKGKRNYTYDIEDIPQKEIWKFKEQSGSWGAQIDYSNACAIGSNKNNEKTYLVDELTTDVELCINNPSSDSNVVEDAGFVMIATTHYNGNYYVITEQSLNDSLSWPKLVRNYHFHNRPINKGDFNGVASTFLSTKPFKKGDKISIPIECGETFDPNNTILTELGVGVVEKAKFNLKTCMLDLELAYNVFESLTTNMAPVIVGNSALQTYANVPLIFPINASDSDGVITQIGISYQAYNGTVTILSTTQAKYTPNNNFVGDDYFTLVAYDDWSEISPVAGFHVTVLPPNQPPVAQPESYNVFHGYPFTTPTSIFANDSDDVGFTLVTTTVVTAQGVTVNIDSNGNFSYTPPNGTFEGTDTFVYTIQDNTGAQSSATVSLVVGFKNRPIAVDDHYNTLKNTQLITNGSPGKEALFYNDYTPDGLSYTYTCTVETKPTAQGGTVSIQSNGFFTYTPPNNFTGTDSFDYTVHNINGSDVGTATISVLPTIYIKLLTSDFKTIGHAGQPYWARTRDYTLWFYQDAAGTIPYDVDASIGLKVLISETTTYDNYGNNGSYTTIWETGVVDGISHKFYDDFVYFERIDDGNGVYGIDVVIAISPGPYVII